MDNRPARRRVRRWLATSGIRRARPAPVEPTQAPVEPTQAPIELPQAPVEPPQAPIDTANGEPPTRSSTAPPVDGASIDARVAAVVATGLWRMRNKMVEPGTDRPPPELRSLFRHLESTWDALTGAGIEIQSHDGVAADPGLALSVVAYQPTPGLDCDRVVETIRPSVYLHGRPIQQGEVVVGTPIEDPLDPRLTPATEPKDPHE